MTRQLPLTFVTPRPPVVRAYLDADEVVADNFAGGGGASTGIEAALRRSPDVAVNHDAEAIALHRANHPTTRHYTESVYKVDPVEAARGRRVGLAWFSPDCKHHSKAKGGKPRDQKIRGLAWIAITWAHRVRPRVIALENVEEFRDWGPLHRTGPDAGKPIKARRGETFRAFVRKLERLGYVVEHRLLRACDFGAPTTRRRMFLIARCDGASISWPVPTHGPDRPAPHRAAAEVIDWSIPCPSIFERGKPLAEKTLARIARGVRKFVLGEGRPFMVPVNHGGVGRRDHRVHDLDAPMPTITGGSRGGHALLVPYLVHRSNGERVGQAPRIYDIEAPLGTIVAQGQKHALCAAFLARHYGGHENDGAALTSPIPTITTQDHHSLVAAFLVRYNGQSTGQQPSEPIGTLDTRDRYGLVIVTIDGEEYVVVDIGMRMLTPRELFLAQGFPADYQIAPIGPKGKPLSKTAQIRMCGNSVAPPVAAAIVRANCTADVALEAA